MKPGDLVIMTGEKLPEGEPAHVGIIVENDRPGRDMLRPGTKKRVGVLWSGETQVDFEPMDWLEVISESR